MNIFIDNNDLEEQYGEQKYKEYLEKENKQMKQDITTMNKEIERLNNIINELEKWLKEKKEQMEEFEFYKRKETGAFWYSTMGNIETFIEKIKELKGVDKE